MSAGATIVLSAGGTGGHVFPAQALAQSLAARGHPLALITDRRGQGYEERFPGMEIITVRAASPGGRGPLGQIAALSDIAAGTLSACAALRRIRPALVVGFGGYPSLPAILAATKLGLPTMLHEQNAVLGRVNRLMAKRVSAIATSFPRTSGIGERDLPKVVMTGNPVRPAVLRLLGEAYAPPGEEGPIELLVLGGSQGARVFSDVVPPAIVALEPALRRRIRVTQQCRPEDLAGAAALYREAGIAAELAPFIEDVPARLARAHLCITRSGASTVAELAIAGRPALLVPYQHATDDHQTANARHLVDLGGGWLVPQAKFTVQTLAECLSALLTDPHTLARAAQAMREAARPRAAEQLADLALRLAAGFRPASGAGRVAA
ncbi:MAG: undecaprenyldiphospho-muramoylpentapeptide beta-N-acetylglucosaminyltransferase [Alphaproteobacteria bacterium]|nr:undecaprenyldiphospho-muramoylpentapeptide beta-N-acetylglucosaminyltransferase [Alphaproteobacteria bacterium]